MTASLFLRPAATALYLHTPYSPSLHYSLAKLRSVRSFFTRLWSQQAKFARTGGEANAIAIRIARAASGKEKIAICGYHGWHDWYLSANLKNNKNLDNHLMSGFYTAGVPKFLSNKSYPFKFNNSIYY